MLSEILVCSLIFAGSWLGVSSKRGFGLKAMEPEGILRMEQKLQNWSRLIMWSVHGLTSLPPENYTSLQQDHLLWIIQRVKGTYMIASENVDISLSKPIIIGN